ncbi:DNA polymerase III subunit gamma/tau [Mucilaginibacter polytrichastri]|uniref:DNA polymerase III subunit gamma/tau n=1 Tax=Mucilaginibacter polytrichastri TaxID=1302689 RepID=A0A1Q5ZT80_9SPHI|nr:DNA polymerase III subunit gamma/tau [Mucilaginibacter polytrichastri]OKS84979.1 DNA polymerase III subunit gamma [Mucilaginibacter polytrichastri]
MDNFIVSARKYRPATFETVVGQQHVTNTLKNAIKSNQLAQAFLFCGPRGVGKTTCARILAKTINCTNLQPNGEACGTCDSCRAFQNGNSFNVHELDAASNNSVDDIRNLIDQVRIPPQAGRYKVYIIDEVHMLSQAAFNAFLKTLEEPPNYAIFILATTEKHKILPTILSRCQIFDFNRIRVDDMSAHLASIAQKESIAYEDDGLHIIAQKADGGLRDALSMFDQIVSFSGGNVTYKTVIDNLNILDYDYYFSLTDGLMNEETAKTLLIFDEILSKGFDGSHFINGLSNHFRNLLVGKDAATLKLLEVSDGVRQRYLQQSQQATGSFLLSALNIANQCEINYRLSKNQRLQVELALLKMCHLTSAFNLAASPLQNTPANDSQLKKKPDTTAITPPAQAYDAPKTATVVNEAPAGYQSPQAETPKQQPVTASPQITPPVTAIPKITVDIAVAPSTPTAPSEKPKIVMPTRSSMIPSLNAVSTATAEMVDEDDPYIKGTDQQPFTTDAFLQKWSEYTVRLKNESKMGLFTIFSATAPVMVRPNEFEVIVSNKAQENDFRDEKPELMNFLRTELRNFSIEVKARIEEITTARRPYTDIEKFQHMAAKNPQLTELYKRFNLDLS